MKSIQSKKAAIELSIGTIVVIVLAMSMLILGIVLVRNIFGGATDATDLINKNVESQINELFNDDTRRTVVYLPNNQADVKKGRSYNLKFAIKNVVRGESEAGTFTYTVSATEVEQGCTGLSLAQASKFISLGASGGPVKIIPGSDPREVAIRLSIPENAPLCDVSYDISVNKDGQLYDTNFFILTVTG